MKKYLRITQILEDDVNMPQVINLEVDDKDDAESKADIFANMITGEKKISYIVCRHEEGLPCTEEILDI